MANKTKRSVSTGTNGEGKTAVRTVNKPFSTEFKPDYSQVKDDLKRIAILAGIFVVVLVALSFILH
jgi:hypothetical protein